MAEKHRVGSRAAWNWGNGTGKVEDVFTGKVTRAASDDDPAYLLRQEDGDRF